MECPLPFRDLVNLGQCAFHETGGAAYDGHHPHPEDSPRSPQHNSDSHTGNVSHTHTAGGTDTKCLERRYLSRPPVSHAFHQHTEHFPKIPDLHKSRTDRKVKSQPDQQYDQYIGPEDCIDLVDDGI